jgi:hypothetical protein
MLPNFIRWLGVGQRQQRQTKPDTPALLMERLMNLKLRLRAQPATARPDRIDHLRLHACFKPHVLLFFDVERMVVVASTIAAEGWTVQKPLPFPQCSASD